MIIKLAEGPLRTLYGEFTEMLFYDGQKESVALVLGDVAGEDLLCRIHSACIFGHYFNSVECDCRQQMDRAQAMIAEAGRGIIILLDQEGKGNGHFALLKSVAFKRQGMKQSDAYEAAGFKSDARDFSAAGKILQHLGVRSIQLLSGNTNKARGLGVEVSGIVPLDTV